MEEMYGAEKPCSGETMLHRRQRKEKERKTGVIYLLQLFETKRCVVRMPKYYAAAWSIRTVHALVVPEQVLRPQVGTWMAWISVLPTIATDYVQLQSSRFYLAVMAVLDG